MATEMVAQPEDCVQALRMTDSDKVISDNAECVDQDSAKGSKIDLWGATSIC